VPESEYPFAKRVGHPQTLKEARERMEREMVQDALRRHRGENHSCRVGTWHQPADAV
jgi:hypothetical protein